MRERASNEMALDRRRFLYLAAAGGAALWATGLGLAGAARGEDMVTLPPLPYAMDALEPYISARTMEFHYGKHHAGYVKKTNAALQEMSLKPRSLEALIQVASKGEHTTGLFDNASQVFNHDFYWQSLKPGAGGPPQGKMLKLVNKYFGSYENFKNKMAETANGQFGSGWAWLIQDMNGLSVISTMNADSPLAHGPKPILTIDVWEHAYYLDYQNRRGDYVMAILDNLLNWDFAEANITRGLRESVS